MQCTFSSKYHLCYFCTHVPHRIALLIYCMVVAESDLAVISPRQEGLHHIPALHILSCCAKSPFLDRELHKQFQSAAGHCLGWGMLEEPWGCSVLQGCCGAAEEGPGHHKATTELEMPSFHPAPLLCVTLGSTKISAQVKWGKCVCSPPAVSRLHSWKLLRACEHSVGTID